MNKTELKEKQKWEYGKKVNVSLYKIQEFCMLNENNVCVAFSGGADSTVLLDLVCKVWKKILNNPCELTVIYANTSNEFEKMQEFARNQVKRMEEKYEISINFKVVRSNRTFYDVVKNEGYPVVSKKVARMVRSCREFFNNSNINYEEVSNNLDEGIKSAEYLRKLKIPDGVICYLTGITSTNKECMSWKLPKKWRKLIVAPFNITEKCCDILKKEPLKLLEKETKKGVFVGTMAVDSKAREESYLKTGCIIFNKRDKKCVPMSFWLNQDKMQYLVQNKLDLAPMYGEIKKNEKEEYYFTGEQHTGCKLCLFGCHLEKNPNRIQRLKYTEPNTYNFALRKLEDRGLGYADVMNYIGIKYK